MQRMFGLAVALSATLAPTQLSAAQEKDERVAELEREKAYYEAKAAAETAKANAVAARIAPLTALAGDGKTTLGSGAGGPEAWFLSREAIMAAAKQIKDNLPSTGKIVLLAGDEALNLSQVPVIKQEAETISADFVDAVDGVACPTRDAGLPIAAALGAVGSLLQTSTEIHGLDVSASHRLLVTAIAQELADRAILPSAMMVPEPRNAGLARMLSTLRNQNSRALAVRACIGDNKKLAGKAKQLDAASARFGTFTQRIATAGDNGKSPLGEALIAEAIIAENPTVARIYLDKAGGTLISKKNLLTAFGAPPVSVTGGLVASFVATYPTTGVVARAGTIACSTDQRSIRAAHQLYPTNGTNVANCSQ